MTTIGRTLHRATATLQDTSDSAAMDARLLLAHVLDVSLTRLYSDPQSPVETADLQQYQALIDRRATGEPLAYITGRRGFWTLELDVNPAVLVPRPDTETLVATALDILPDDHCRVADLGTGSGAIALALAADRPNWSVTATDACAEALQCARENAKRLGLTRLELRHGHWFEPLAGRSFDAIVCNPPYVAPDDSHLQAPELGHEPAHALVAADHGLADITHIARNAPAHLDAGGWLLLEHGFDQGAAARALLTGAGFQDIETRPDLAGRDRVSLGRAPR